MQVLLVYSTGEKVKHELTGSPVYLAGRRQGVVENYPIIIALDVGWKRHRRIFAYQWDVDERPDGDLPTYQEVPWVLAL